MIEIERIKKECFWDFDFSDKEIAAMFESGDIATKKFLFEKILLNSSKLFFDLRNFEKSELTHLVDSYKIPQFNHDFVARRHNMVEAYMLDRPLTVSELKWVV